MALEKQLSDTDSIYCTKVTNSNQSSIFISNLGDGEPEVLFGANYQSNDTVRLRLNKRNLAFVAISHVIDGRTWYKRKSSDNWVLDSSWLDERIKTLEDVFGGDDAVFLAQLNKDDHSTNRLYMKGVTSLTRDDGKAHIALRDFLFSGDVIVLTKLDNGDVSLEVKIPDNPIIEFNGHKERHSESTPLPRQLIIYGAPGTGKSWRIKSDTKGMSVIRTTFHPDSDYSTFVGAYKPSMEDDGFKTVVTTGEVSPNGSISKKDGLVTQKHIVYKFVAQAFLKAYVEAWRKKATAESPAESAENAEAECGSELSAASAPSAGENKNVYLVIEEINRGNCAQIFGDLFQLLDRDDCGYSDYEISADDDLRRYLKEAFKGVNVADAQSQVPPVVAAKLERVFKGEILLLPENLYIWATMNTSDQSLFPIDSAFKRRWAWKYIPISNADKNYTIEVGSDRYDWWTFLEKANALVERFTDSEDKKLGYFFCKADKNGVISLEQFVGKVVFYLWNGVFKDTGFDDEVFDDGNGDKLHFKCFFDSKGDPNGDAVRQLMKNLGVENISPAESAETAESGGE